MSNSSKYKSALEKYNINLNDAEIKKEVDLLIKNKGSRKRHNRCQKGSF